MRVFWSILCVLGSFIVVENSYGVPRGIAPKPVTALWQSLQQNKYIKAAGTLLAAGTLCTMLSCAPNYSNGMPMAVYEEKMGRIEQLEKQQEHERQLLHEYLVAQDMQLVRERQEGREFDLEAYRDRIQYEQSVKVEHWQKVLALARQEDMAGFFYFANNPLIPPVGHNFQYYADGGYGERVEIDERREWHPITPHMFEIPYPPLSLDYTLSLGVEREGFISFLLDYPHLYMGKLITFYDSYGSIQMGIVCSYSYYNPTKLIVAYRQPTYTFYYADLELMIIGTDQVSGILFNENYIDREPADSNSFLNRNYANYEDSSHTGYLAFTPDKVDDSWRARLQGHTWIENDDGLGTTFWMNFSDGYRYVEVSHTMPVSEASFPPAANRWHKLERVTSVLIHTDKLSPASPPTRGSD